MVRLFPTILKNLDLFFNFWEILKKKNAENSYHHFSFFYINFLLFSLSYLIRHRCPSNHFGIPSVNDEKSETSGMERRAHTRWRSERPPSEIMKTHDPRVALRGPRRSGARLCSILY